RVAPGTRKVTIVTSTSRASLIGRCPHGVPLTTCCHTPKLRLHAANAGGTKNTASHGRQTCCSSWKSTLEFVELSIELQIAIIILLFAIKTSGFWALFSKVCMVASKTGHGLSGNDFLRFWLCVLCVYFVSLVGLLFAFRVNALQPGFDAGAWVKIIAQSVTDEVEGQHRQHDSGSGEEDNVRRVKQMRAPVVQHRA